MKKKPLCLEKTVMVNQLAYMQERTLPPPRFKTLGIYTELNHPLLRDILCSATEKWTMAMGRIIREEPIFFLLSMYDIVCDFSRNLSHCQFSAIFFFSSSFYSRYHIEIRTYFYIIYMHNCFHNRGGVFNFQIIRDRIVIAWFFF